MKIFTLIKTERRGELLGNYKKGEKQLENYDFLTAFLITNQPPNEGYFILCFRQTINGFSTLYFLIITIKSIKTHYR